MKGKWEVTTNLIGCAKMYAPMRVKDTSRPPHSGNLEIGKYFKDRSDAEDEVYRLNMLSEFYKEQLGRK